MFSKADPHKQLFQLLLAIQGLRKNLLYETMTQMAWESFCDTTSGLPQN